MRNRVHLKPAAPESVHIVQISDTHIASDPAVRYDGVDTAATLSAVVDHLCAVGPAPDCYLLTGDLADDPVEASYDRLRGLLSPLPAPVFCLPGNHDEPGIMRARMNRDNVSSPRLVETDGWSILLLDTFVAGMHGGRLGDSELQFLRDSLAAGRDRHILVCLHHPPVPIGSTWMDGMMLENPQDFFAIIDTAVNVRGIVWGHIHQEFTAERKGIQLLGAPSTCVQFTPGTDRYLASALQPGYRELELLADGRIQTRVLQIPN
jgi:Icc protein